MIPAWLVTRVTSLIDKAEALVRKFTQPYVSNRRCLAPHSYLGDRTPVPHRAVGIVVARRMHKSRGSTARQTDIYGIGGVVSDHPQSHAMVAAPCLLDL